MAISVVQKVGYGEGSTVTSQATGSWTTQNTTAGNAFLVPIIVSTNASQGSPTISSIADTGGAVNTYHLAISKIENSGGSGWVGVWIYYTFGIAGGNKNGVTVNFGVTCEAAEVGAIEVSGINTFDTVTTNTNGNTTGTTLTTGTTGTLTVANEIAMGIAACHSQTETWSSLPSGWAQQFNDTGATFVASDVETLIVSATTALNPSWTVNTNDTWAACIATFYQSSGGYIPRPLGIFNSNAVPLAPYSPSNPNVPMMAPPVGQKKIFIPTPKEVRKVAASRRLAA